MPVSLAQLGHHAWRRLANVISGFIKLFVPKLKASLPEHTTLPSTDVLPSDSDGNESSMSVCLDMLLNIPGFPHTDEDAENILRFVRSQRDECELTKEAAEQSVHRCILGIQIFQRHPRDSDDDLTVRQLVNLERCREALTKALEAIEAADLRVGAVRTLLRQKALPLIFPQTAEFRGFPLKPHPIIHHDDRSDDTQHSDGFEPDSDMESED